MTAIEAGKAPRESEAERRAGREARNRNPWPARILKVAVPLSMLVLMVVLWHYAIVWNGIEHYILPEPSAVVASLVRDWPVLGASLLITLKITFSALGLAIVGGVLLAIVMAQSRWIELAILPYTVILQVTPVIAIAPLILIWVRDTQVALLILAFVVAFFPILSNTAQGLKSTDHNLLNLFELYRANRWQTLIRLRIPNALPFFLTGLRTAGGLALIAAVVAEFAAGSAGKSSGLAFRVLESQFRMKTDRLFAALILLSLTGVAIFAATSFVSWLLLRKWHESAVRREN